MNSVVPLTRDWPVVDRVQSLVDGESPPLRAGGVDLPIVNPATEEALTVLREADAAEVDAAIASARRAFETGPWPRMDINEKTQDAFMQALQSDYNINFAGNSLGGATDVCNFIEGGTASIGWDGGVSPCWPLMHNHTSYLHGKPHRSRRHVVGNVNERELLDIWLDEAYVTYRQKVQSFAFAPCTYCGGCELSEENEEDCFGNEFPACGGCLWAQGVIQCS